MSSFTPQQKHNILTHYSAHQRGAGFKALARRFAVQGGHKLIREWHARWDGTPVSLEHKGGAGRPRVLSTRQVQQHVRAPILRANQAHTAIHYTDLRASIQRKTGKSPSLRTVQRYGKEEQGAKQKHTKKRTAVESEYIHTTNSERRVLLPLFLT